MHIPKDRYLFILQNKIVFSFCNFPLVYSELHDLIRVNSIYYSLTYFVYYILFGFILKFIAVAVNSKRFSSSHFVFFLSFVSFYKLLGLTAAVKVKLTPKRDALNQSVGISPNFTATLMSSKSRYPQFKKSKTANDFSCVFLLLERLILMTPLDDSFSARS